VRGRRGRLKILVDGIIFGRQRFGGVSRVWEEYLTRLPGYGVKLKLLVPFRRKNPSLVRILQHQGRYEIVQDYLYWPSRCFERVATRSRILEWYLDDSVDIFHSTYFTTVFNKRVGKVVTVHDMIPEIFERDSRDRWTHFVINMKRRVMENADAIIADSRNTKKDILNIYPKIPEERVSVVYNALSLRSYRECMSFEYIADKYSLDIRPGEYLLFVGLRGGYKNFRLIQELLENDRSYRHLVFVCVGGEKDDQLQRILEAKGLSRNFKLLGPVQDNVLLALYQNALALVYPSLYEGFGLPILEAMANGCPVLCSNTSCLPEVAGEAAIYFDPYSAESLGEAIAELLRREKAAIIAKGLENIKRFSWEKSTKTLVDIYKSLS